jgi:spore photoproduct lyase
MKLPFKKITIDRQMVDTPMGARIPEGEVVSEPPKIDQPGRGKKHLHIARKHGQALDLCASLNPEYICCATHVLRAISNCPYDCTYCFLQSYLTNSTLSVVADTRALLDEVRAKTAEQPWRFFRIGTWELGDSLALEPFLGAAGELVSGFSKMPGALLELRTKSDCVDPLLDLDHRGHTVVSWSLSPNEVINREERRAASLEERLGAMKKTVASGYLTALHFDPVIYYEGWEDGYDALAKAVFEAVSPARVAWISIGGLRFNPEMKKQIEARFPSSRLTSAEMVLGGDGKVRYVKPTRLKMFSFLVDRLRRYGGREPFIYLCMERWDVWERVLGTCPESIGHLDYRITKSLFERYPGLVPAAPILEQYVGESL